LAGDQLGVQVREFWAKAGFPHVCNLAIEPPAQPFRGARHLKYRNTYRSNRPRRRGQLYGAVGHLRS
jgi:hypothetical protein